MNEQDQAARAWKNLARRATRKVNFGWWLDRFSPLLIGVGVVAAAAILILRSRALLQASHTPLLIATAALLAATAIAAWLLARRNFLGERESLVRLEDRLQLKNALTTAESGVGHWPRVPSDPERIDPGLEWNWTRVFGPLLVATLAVAAAMFVPVSTVSAARTPPSEPLAWAQMEEWMELLEEDNLIKEEGIEEIQEKIEELRNQPEDEWFSHSSLEATDTLRQTLRQQIQNLGAELANAERDLNALQNYGSQLSEESKEKLLAEYDQALQNLALSGLPLNPELMKMLQGIDPSQLAKNQMSVLTPEQMDALREALQKGAKACAQCNGNGQGEGLPKLGEGDEALMALLKQGQQGGRGDITRGPGPAPLFLGDNETDLGTSQIEGVENADLSKAAPGDVLGVGQTEHDLDEKSVGPRQAGEVGSMGQGGDTVWKESLMPTEKAVLKRYFK